MHCRQIEALCLRTRIKAVLTLFQVELALGIRMRRKTRQKAILMILIPHQMTTLSTMIRLMRTLVSSLNPMAGSLIRRQEAL